MDGAIPRTAHAHDTLRLSLFTVNGLINSSTIRLFDQLLCTCRKCRRRNRREVKRGHLRLEARPRRRRKWDGFSWHRQHLAPLRAWQALDLTFLAKHSH